MPTVIRNTPNPPVLQTRTIIVNQIVRSTANPPVLIRNS